MKDVLHVIAAFSRAAQIIRRLSFLLTLLLIIVGSIAVYQFGGQATKWAKAQLDPHRFGGCCSVCEELNRKMSLEMNEQRKFNSERFDQ